MCRSVGRLGGSPSQCHCLAIDLHRRFHQTQRAGREGPAGGERPSVVTAQGRQRPATCDRRPATGDRRPATGEPATGDRTPATDDRRPATGESRDLRTETVVDIRGPLASPGGSEEVGMTINWRKL